MKVLVACEESQTVCKAFRGRGHEAYSCDIQEPSGGYPEWHILGDALKAVDGGQITTMDGVTHDIGKWDLLIAHSPCTYFTVAGNRWFSIEKYGDKARKRAEKREHAVAFFMSFINAPVGKIAVENPVGYMSRRFRKPDCIIQPFQFGEHARKATCLWLKNLPSLTPTKIVDPGEILPGGVSVGAYACIRKRTIKSAQASYQRRRNAGVLKKSKKPATHPCLKKTIKPIEQCVRGAAALGLTYGQYVARGLDKE